MRKEFETRVGFPTTNLLSLSTILYLSHVYHLRTGSANAYINECLPICVLNLSFADFVYGKILYYSHFSFFASTHFAHTDHPY